MEKKSANIALLTDFGTKDWYVSQMKGAILSINPDASILDLTHDLQAFDVQSASYVISKACNYFDEPMIFVVVVDPGVGTGRDPVAVQTAIGHIFVGPDNGVLTRIIKSQQLAAAHILSNKKYYRNEDVSSTFHGRDIFGPVAAYLSKGVSLSDLGPVAENLKYHAIPDVSRADHKVKGEIVHIDRYGNIITNIKSSHMQEVEMETLLKVFFDAKRFSAPFVKTYGKAPDDRLFCLINSEGELEFAMKGESAAKKYKINPGTVVTVNF